MGQETAKDSPKLSQEELAGLSIRWLCRSCWIFPKVFGHSRWSLPIGKHCFAICHQLLPHFVVVEQIEMLTDDALRSRDSFM